MRYLGRPASREVLRDEIIPFHLGVYQRFDRLGTWAAESASNAEFLGWFHLRPEDGDITNIHWATGCADQSEQRPRHRGSTALINMSFADLGVQRVRTYDDGQRRVPARAGESGLTLVHTVPYQGPDADVIDGASRARSNTR